MTSRRRWRTWTIGWWWISPSPIHTAIACSSRYPQMRPGPRGARFALGAARVRGRRPRGAQVFDRPVVAHGEMVEPARDAPRGTVAVAYAVVEQYPRTVDQATNVVSSTDEVVRLGKPDP